MINTGEKIRNFRGKIKICKTTFNHCTIFTINRRECRDSNSNFFRKIYRYMKNPFQFTPHFPFIFFVYTITFLFISPHRQKSPRMHLSTSHRRSIKFIFNTIDPRKFLGSKCRRHLVKIYFQHHQSSPIFG